MLITGARHAPAAIISMVESTRTTTPVLTWKSMFASLLEPLQVSTRTTERRGPSSSSGPQCPVSAGPSDGWDGLRTSREGRPTNEGKK